MRELILCLRKDFLCLARRPAIVVGLFGFAFLLVVVASFAFRWVGIRIDEIVTFLPGLIWIILLFSTVVLLEQSFMPEREGGALRFLMLIAEDGTAIFFSKVISLLVVMGLVSVLVFTGIGVMFGVSFWQQLWHLVTIVSLAMVGVLAAGVLLSAVSSTVQHRELLLPLLFFPLMIVPSAAVVELLRVVLESGVLDLTGIWFSLLVAFSSISVVVSWVLFDSAVRA